MTCRGDWYEGDVELSMTIGEASSTLYPDDVSMFTDTERDEWREEIAAQQARKRPPGFTAWKTEPAEPSRLRVVS